MTTMTGEPELILFRSERFQRKLARSLAIIQVAIRGTLRPYVAFSGGKDSVATLALVHHIAPETELVWSDDELEYPETVEFMRAVQREAGQQFIVVSGWAQHAGWFDPWRSRPFWRDPLPGMRHIRQDTDDWARTKGYDLTFTGVRQSENKRRRDWLVANGPIYEVRTGTRTRCCPLAEWTDDDVWCIPDEIPVLTPNGAMPIGEYVDRGHWIRTPIRTVTGWEHPVAVAQKVASELCSIQTSHGVLRCTPEHRILTLDRGWIHSCDLRPDDTLLLWGGWLHEVDARGRRSAPSGLELRTSYGDSRSVPWAIVEELALARESHSKANPLGITGSHLPGPTNDMPYGDRGGVCCGYCGRGGMDRNDNAKESRKRSEESVWCNYVSRCREHEYCFVGMVGREDSLSYRRSAAHVGRQTEGCWPSDQPAANTSNPPPDYALYDHQATAGRDHASISCTAVRPRISGPIYSGGCGRLQRIEAAQWLCSRVIAVRRESGPVRVYDLQTESSTFLANGLIVHNCFIAGWGLPINPVYRRLAEIGVPRERQRVGPLPLTPRAYLADGWPALLTRLETRYGQRWR